MKRIIYLILLSLGYGSQTYFQTDGYINFAYISRLSDNSIIDIPYRLSIINFARNDEKISLYGSLALEYQLRDENYYLSSKNPQDFRFDLRELYAAFSGNNYEFKKFFVVIR